MESCAPQSALQEPLVPAPPHRHTQPQLSWGPAGIRGSPSPALTPQFPRLGLARPLAAPLRSEEGSVMAGAFQRAINLPASHASQLQPGSDLYASEVHQREKYFPGTVYPPSPLSLPHQRELPRVQSLAKKPRSHPSPPHVTPCPRHPAPGTPPLPGICKQKKTSSGFLASMTHQRESH